jgi:hypothetical protein
MSPASIMGPPWRHKHGTTSGLPRPVEHHDPGPVGNCQVPLVTERLGSVLPCNQQTQIGLDCPGAGARSPLQMSSVDRRDCL